MYGYYLKISSIPGTMPDVYEFDTAFYLEGTDVHFKASGTCPSIEACFDRAQEYKESVLRQRLLEPIDWTKIPVFDWTCSFCRTILPSSEEHCPYCNK